MYLLMTQTFNFINSYLYPKMYPIHDIIEALILRELKAG